MKNWVVIWLCVLLVLGPATALPFPAEASPAGVAASSRDVIEIHDVHELQAVQDNLTGNYALANDIDASETMDWNDGAGFLPLSNSSDAYYLWGYGVIYPHAFNGTFDGRGHAITGLFINRPTNFGIGLFGISGGFGVVSNVTMLGLTVVGNRCIGGLAGVAYGTISGCSVNGTVSGTEEVGGLVGRLLHGSISCCDSSVTVRAVTNAGGLVGHSWDGDVITRSYSTGAVAGSEDLIGGFVGETDRTVFSRCFSSGSAYGTTANVAGFVGSDVYGTYADCHSTGAVSGTSTNIGGFAGVLYGTTITNCYSAGSVGGTGGSAGGFVGTDDSVSTVTGCFWDNQTSGMTTSYYGTGKSTADMMKKATFVDWNFSGTWTILDGQSYPYLLSLDTHPRIAGADVLEATEDAPYLAHYDMSFNRYPSFNDLAWSFYTSAAEWLSFNSTTGNLSGTPDNADVGSFWVNLSVNDMLGYYTFRNFTIDVENVPPVFTSVPPPEGLSVDQDQNLSFDVGCDDEGLGNTAYQLSKAPDWLVIGATDGKLSGRPGNGDIGQNLVELAVYDGWGGRTNHTFYISVLDVNDPPAITTSDIPAATQGIMYGVVFEAADIDPVKELFAWSLSTNASWLSMNSQTGVISGTPANADVGSWTINVTVVDGRGGQDSHDFTLAVANVNDPPVILTQPVATATEDILYTVNFTASDPDAGDMLTWSLATLADWLVINSTTGVLSGTPGEKDVGSAWVAVTITDAAGAGDTAGYNLRVANVNDPPAWVSVPGDVNITEGRPLLAIVLAEDPDAGDKVRYSMSSAPASGMSIDAVSGAVFWANATAGNYTVTVTATDGNVTIGHLFNVTVNMIPPPPANRPPAINHVANLNGRVGVTLVLKLTGSDPDSHDASNLTFRLLSGPAGMVVSADGNLVWTPAKDQLGTHTITASLSDGKNSTTTSFTVTVVKPAAAGGSAPESGNSPALMAGLLVVGLVVGAVAAYALARRNKPSPPVEGQGDEKGAGKEE